MLSDHLITTESELVTVKPVAADLHERVNESGPVEDACTLRVPAFVDTMSAVLFSNTLHAEAAMPADVHATTTVEPLEAVCGCAMIWAVAAGRGRAEAADPADGAAEFDCCATW